MRKLAFLAVAAAFAAPAYAQMSCESLAGLSLPDTTITVAAVVPAGAFNPNITTTACRVAGSIRPTADSDIRFEVWMPAAGWNGKLQAVGNGAWAGTISHSAMATALAAGYAATSTDTGHRGGGADFLQGHPDLLVDFAHRAVHEMAVTAKAVVASIVAIFAADYITTTIMTDL